MKYAATVMTRIQSSIEIEAKDLDEAMQKAKNITWNDVMLITWPEDGELYLSGIVELSTKGLILER